MQFGKGDSGNFNTGKEQRGWVSIDGPHSTQIYVGTATKGKSETTGKKETYAEYAGQLNTIEHAGTYYAFPSIQAIIKLKEQLPPGFKLAVKLPQTITHLKKLRNVEVELSEFQDIVMQLGDNLGPLMIMPHPGIGPADIDTLKHFLDQIRLPSVLELRHEDWFKEGYNMDLFQYLVGRNIGTVISDTPGRRDAVHMHLTTPDAFIRFACTGREDIDQIRLDAWYTRLSDWMKAGLNTLYFFVHADFEQQELARKLAVNLKLRLLNLANSN